MEGQGAEVGAKQGSRCLYEARNHTRHRETEAREEGMEMRLQEEEQAQLVLLARTNEDDGRGKEKVEEMLGKVRVGGVPESRRQALNTSSVQVTRLTQAKPFLV